MAMAVRARRAAGRRPRFRRAPRAAGAAVGRVVADARRARGAHRAARGRERRPRVVVRSFGGAVASGRVWLLAIVLLHDPRGALRMGFWLPQIIKAAAGGSDAMAGVLTAIPYAVAAVGMVVVGRHSDRTGERRWHIAVCAVVGGTRVCRVGVRRRHRAVARARCRWPCSAWRRCSGRSGRWRPRR